MNNFSLSQKIKLEESSPTCRRCCRRLLFVATTELSSFLQLCILSFPLVDPFFSLAGFSQQYTRGFLPLTSVDRFLFIEVGFSYTPALLHIQSFKMKSKKKDCPEASIYSRCVYGKPHRDVWLAYSKFARANPCANLNFAQRAKFLLPHS
jgi:hypothetical protein